MRYLPYLAGLERAVPDSRFEEILLTHMIAGNDEKPAYRMGDCIYWGRIVPEGLYDDDGWLVCAFIHDDTSIPSHLVEASVCRSDDGTPIIVWRSQETGSPTQ